MKRFEAPLNVLVDAMLVMAKDDPVKLAELEKIMREAYWRIVRNQSSYQPNFSKLMQRRQ